MKNLIQNFLVAWKLPRWRWALVIVVLSDTLSACATLTPEQRWLSDALTLAALFAILDFRWSFLLAIAVESVPWLELLPVWTLVVAALASIETRKQSHSTGVVEQDAPSIQTQ